MKIRYYLINKAQRQEYERFKNVFNRTGKSFYLKMLRYCKEKNGVVVNIQYGEKFCEKFQEMLNTTIKETENDYKFLIGITTEDGFYLSDMKQLGIENFVQLLNFLRSNESWIVEDDRGTRVTINDLKSLAHIKGIKPHYKETVNGLTARRIDRGISSLQLALKDVQQAIEDEKYTSTRNMELVELESDLIKGLSALEKVNNYT